MSEFFSEAFWKAAPLLGGGTVLLIVIAYLVYRAHLANVRRDIAAIEQRSPEAARIVDELSHVNALLAGATKEQKFEIAKQVMAQREQRSTTLFALGVLAIIVFAIVTTVVVLSGPPVHPLDGAGSTASTPAVSAPSSASTGSTVSAGNNAAPTPLAAQAASRGALSVADVKVSQEGAEISFTIKVKNTHDTARLAKAFVVGLKSTFTNANPTYLGSGTHYSAASALVEDTTNRTALSERVDAKGIESFTVTVKIHARPGSYELTPRVEFDEGESLPLDPVTVFYPASRSGGAQSASAGTASPFPPPSP